MTAFQKIVRKVVQLEGGLSLDPADPGNWTGGERNRGALLGTKYGISAASYPTLDIPNLTVEDAISIYYRDYWLRAGLHELPAAFAAVVFDVAVNSGLRTAANLLAASTGFNDFVGRRFQHYTTLTQWPLYGRGWTRRFAEMVSFASTLEEDEDGLLIVLNSSNNTVLELPIPNGAHVVTRATGNKYYVRVEHPA